MTTETPVNSGPVNSGMDAAPRVLVRRTRALMWLAAATLAAVIAAGTARWMDVASTAQAFTPERMFPGLAAKLNEVGALTFETKGKMFTVNRTADGKWVLPGKGNFPADRDLVQSTLFSLSETDLVDRRTARKDWHAQLDLGMPKDGGAGSIVTITDVKGVKIGEIVVGKGAEGFGQGDKQAAYVRRVGEDQTYVALGRLQLKAKEADWIDKRFLDYDRARVAVAAIKPPKGPAYTVSRAKAGEENFTLQNELPRGRTLRSEKEPNGVGQALFNLTIDDVVEAKLIDFSKSSFAAFRTFNGVTLSFSIAQKDGDYWATVNATAEDQAPPPPKPGETVPVLASVEARAINERAAGWAFKLPKFKGVLMTAPLEDLLAPLGGSAPPTSTNPEPQTNPEQPKPETPPQRRRRR